MEAEERAFPPRLCTAREEPDPRALCPHLAQVPDLRAGAGGRPSGGFDGVDPSVLWDLALPWRLRQRLKLECPALSWQQGQRREMQGGGARERKGVVALESLGSIS